jgi:uncharacterized protein (TIGR03067 family)
LVLLLGPPFGDAGAVPDRTSKQQLVKAEKQTLQGSWVMVKWQKGSSVVLYNAYEKFYVWTFRGDLLTAKQGALGWPMDCNFTIDPTTKPKRLDAVERGGANRGKTGHYLYHLDGDTLTVCFGGIGQPRPKDFTGKGAMNSLILVFIRTK